jgi:hypothetical protein
MVIIKHIDLNMSHKMIKKNLYRIFGDALKKKVYNKTKQGHYFLSGSGVKQDGFGKRLAGI